MDAHTKVFALFLETLCELVTSHKADLYDWLYVLLTRLLNTLGADLLGSVIHKINRTLDVVRESFSYEEQLMVVFKFIVDQTQTPNSKVKLNTLQYLKSLVTLVESADIPVNKDSEMALAKIITWTSEPKSADIRRAAHGAVVSMFNTHTPQMSQIVAQLPQLNQDSCAEILDKQMPAGESPLRPGDLADEKDSGISQVSVDGLASAGIEDKLAMLEIQAGLEASNLNGRVANGRGRGPQAMDDMLYGDFISNLTSAMIVLRRLSPELVINLEVENQKSEDNVKVSFADDQKHVQIENLGKTPNKGKVTKVLAVKKALQKNPVKPVASNTPKKLKPSLTSTGHANSPGRGYQKCFVCEKIIDEGHHYFSSTVTGKKYLLPFEEINCKSSKLIYLVSCGKCGRQYVGRCETSLKRRHHKHRSQLRHKTEGIGQHFDSCGGYENFHLSIIEAVTKPQSLKEREVWWMKELKTMYPLGMNLRDEGASGTNTKKKSDATKLKKGLKRL